jgi:hypothetical protein
MTNSENNGLNGKAGTGPQNGRSSDGRFAAGNGGRPKGAKGKYTSLKNEFVNAFLEGGGRRQLSYLLREMPPEFFRLMVALQPREVEADVRTTIMPSADTPPAAPETIEGWLSRRDQLLAPEPESESDAT